MAESKIEIGTPGIRRALKKYDKSRSIAEFIWNGFDAGATEVSIDFDGNTVGFIEELCITDNGSGIPYLGLDRKFKPFLHSDKIIDPDETHHLGPSATHGKNGIGRLTFFTFANHAIWETVYLTEQQQLKTYSIEIDAKNLNQYSPSPERYCGTLEPTHTQTVIKFTNCHNLNAMDFDEIKAYLVSEFSWFLELRSPMPRKIKIRGDELDYKKFVEDRKEQNIIVQDLEFEVRYIRWRDHLREYSRYYFLGSDNRERAKMATSYNNKGDGFYHSVYVKGSFFDSFLENTSIADDELNLEQTSLEFLELKRNSIFQELRIKLDRLLQEKRSPFLRRRAVRYVEDLQVEGAFPSFGPEPWEQIKKEELTKIVTELYQIDVRVFNGLNQVQRSTLVRLFSLVMDSNERDTLLDIIQELIKLNSSEREELSRILKSSQLSSVIATIRLIMDRFTAVDELKKLVLNKAFGANERDHLQTQIQQHCWLFGEQFNLVTDAEPDFEQALRRYLYLLRGEASNAVVDHPDKNKEMDVFAVRWLHENDSISNLVLELKHPNIVLGEKELNQVKKYVKVIRDQPDFNASNMTWSFYLIGNKLDEYIKSELENSYMHGERHLVFKSSAQNYRIYVMTWSELFTSFELKHRFLQEKLELQRRSLATKATNADAIITNGYLNSAKVPKPMMPLR